MRVQRLRGEMAVYIRESNETAQVVKFNQKVVSKTLSADGKPSLNIQKNLVKLSSF